MNCKWTSKVDQNHVCSRSPIESSEYCLLHHPGDKNIERMQSEINDLLSFDHTNDPVIRVLRGAWFPCSVTNENHQPTTEPSISLPNEFKRSLDLNEIRVQGDLTLSGTHVRGGISLNGCEVSGSIYLDQAEFGGSCSIAEASIGKDICAFGFSFSSLRLDRSNIGHSISLVHVKCPNGSIEASDLTVKEFHAHNLNIKHLILSHPIIGQNFSIDSSTISGDLSAIAATIGGSLTILDTHLDGNLQLPGLKCTMLRLFRVSVRGWVALNELECSSKCVWTLVTAELPIQIKNAILLGEVDFRLCNVASLDLGIGRPSTSPFLKNRQGIEIESAESAQSFWRFAKKAFEIEGRLQEADAAHFFGRVARMKEYLNKNTNESRILLILEFVLRRLVWLADLVLLRAATAYGASLARLGLAWGTIISFFAFMYWGVQGLNVPVSLGRAFYFSVVTFTTLGFGDVYPTGNIGPVLAGIEASLGAITMALSVLVIGRRFMR